MTIFDFSVSTSKRARNTYPRHHRRCISRYCTIKDLQESTIPRATLQPQRDPSGSLSTISFRERFTHNVFTYTCAPLPSSVHRLLFLSSRRLGRFVSRADRFGLGYGFTAAEGFGLRLSRISLKDFRRVDRGSGPPDAARNDEATKRRQLVGFEGDDPAERRRRILVSH